MDEEQSFQTLDVNGIELAYSVRGEGEPLFLLHGFSGAGGDWVHVFDLDALAGDHRLVIPDLRGHGRSTNGSWPLTHRQCALDLLALASHLEIVRFKAIGLSLGGNTLLHAATLEPQRVEAMVIAAATPRFPEQARAIMRQTRSHPQPPEAWDLARKKHVHGDDQIQALFDQMGAFADDHVDMNFTAESLATIEARTLVVNGDRDPLYPVGMTAELHRGIPGSALWIVPGGGHGPIFGGWRDTFARTALSFLHGDAPSPSGAQP